MTNDPSVKKKRKFFLIGALISFILFLIYIGIMIYFIVTGGTDHYGISRWIPGGTVIDLIFMFVVPIPLQIIAVFFSMLLSRLYIKVARWMKLGRYEIRIKKIEKKFSLGEFLSRAFYASLFAIAMGIAINNFIFDLDSTGNGVALFVPGSMSYSSAALGFILTSVAILLLTPAWILDDSGVIFMKKENYKELADGSILSNSLDVRGVGSYFVTLVKGFAGITTPIFYVLLFIQESILSTNFSLGIMLIFEPFLLVGSFFFSWWIYLKIIPKVRERLLKKLKYPEIRIKIE